VGADNVLCQLHVDAMTYHNQWSLIVWNNCCDVRHCDPAPFRRHYSVTCCISNMPSSYKPLNFCRWVAVGSCTCEGYWVTSPSFCWTWDANLSWRNCVGGVRETFLINTRFSIWYYMYNHRVNTAQVKWDIPWTENIKVVIQFPTNLYF